VTPEQRFYILARNGLGAAFVNAVLNAAIGWAATRNLATLPPWGAPGVALDFVITAFGITFGTCIVLPFQTRRDFEHGRATLPAVGPLLRSVIARFPRSFFGRAVVLGMASVPIFAPPALAVLAVAGPHSVGRVPFIELKALFSAVEGGIVTPFIVLGVLSDLTQKSARKDLSSLSVEAP